MDSLLKSFPLSLIFRGVVPGGFFVISYVSARYGWNALGIIGDGFLTTWLPLAVFSGVIAYIVHRSLIYPLTECFFDSPTMAERREGNYRQPIRAFTIERALDIWRFGDGKSREQNIARHLVDWNTYVHLQYTSVLCIVAGSFFGCIHDKKACWPLIITALVLCIGGLVSHWRLSVVAAKAADERKKRDQIQIN